VLRVDKHNVFPYVGGHNSTVAAATTSIGGNQSSEGKDRPLRTEAEEWSYLASKLVGDVAASAETYLRRVVQKALIHYQRDELWRRLIAERTFPTVSVPMTSSGGSVTQATVDPPQQVLNESSGAGAWISQSDYEIFRSLTFRRQLHVCLCQLAPSSFGPPLLTCS
jgi:hypothetical protein